MSRSRTALTMRTGTATRPKLSVPLQSPRAISAPSPSPWSRALAAALASFRLAPVRVSCACRPAGSARALRAGPPGAWAGCVLGGFDLLAGGLALDHGHARRRGSGPCGWLAATVRRACRSAARAISISWREGSRRSAGTSRSLWSTTSSAKRIVYSSSALPRGASATSCSRVRSTKRPIPTLPLRCSAAWSTR